MITDDSAVEQKAVRLAFRGLQDSKTEVDHLLCQVPSERTLYCCLAGKKNEACLKAMSADSLLFRSCSTRIYVMCDPRWTALRWIHYCCTNAGAEGDDYDVESQSWPS
jgi:hypothetical protein